MSALPTAFPRVPLKDMDPSMLVFELDRETLRLMPEHTELITSAATMASYLHRHQTRMVRGDMPRVPYIEHPLRVALRMVRWGVRDAELIAAALLHDVLEDCAKELVARFGAADEDGLDTLTRLYGNQVAWYVEQVTNPSDGTTYGQHLRNLAALASPALLIKASDLKDNAGSISHQLGHGKDDKLLRMLSKYLPVTNLVAVGLNQSTDPVYIRAAAEMDHLHTDLDALASTMGLG